MSQRDPITAGDGDSRHGTSGGYGNHGCRCDACRDAWAAAIKAARGRRKLRLETATVEHGKSTTYQNHGCRCQPCTDANSATKRRRDPNEGTPQ